MRSIVITAALALVTTTPLLAQEVGLGDTQGYVSGYGGVARALGQNSGDALLEGGVRIAPHVKVVGDLGRFSNLRGDVQPMLDTTTAALAANQGLTVVGNASVPAWYGLGGVRVDVPTRTRVSPFITGGLGVARLQPTAQFAYSGGVLPDGTTPASGSDITSAITSAGLFTTPSARNGLMSMIGGGVLLPVASRLGVEVGYRYSRIASGATVNGTALATNGMTFGVSYHF